MDQFGTFECHVRQLLNELECFRNLDETCRKRVHDVMRVVHRSSDNVIFKQGGEADYCYIIISGEVELIGEGDQLANGYVLQSRQASPDAARHCAVLAEFLKKDATFESMRKPPRAETRNSNVLVSLKPGTMFGAPGSIDGEAPRIVTAKCNGDADLIEIKRKDFDSVTEQINLMRLMRPLANYVQRLLPELPFFKELDNSIYAPLAKLARVCSFDRGDVIWKEGSLATDEIYIVLTGSMQVWKQPSAAQKNAPPPEEGAEEVEFETGTPMAKKICSFFFDRLMDYDMDHHEIPSDGEGTEDGEDDFYATECEHGIELRQLGFGTILGESHAADLNGLRSDTVACSDRSWVLVLRRADVARVAKTAPVDAAIRAAIPDLARPLAEELPLLSCMKPDMRKDLPKYVRFFSAPKDSVLYWQGASPTSCRIIISGSVVAYQRKGSFKDSLSTLPEESHPHGHSHCAEAAEKVSAVQRKAQLQVDMEKDDISDVAESEAAEDNADEADMLEMGDFGLPQEVQSTKLGDPGVVRAYGARVGRTQEVGDILLGSTVLSEERGFGKVGCTYVCEADCQFLSIERSAFLKLVMEEKQRERFRQLTQRIAQLLREIPFFQALSNDVQQSVARASEYCFKREGELVFQEGSHPQACYVVISGEVTVFKKQEAGMQEREPLPAGHRPFKVQSPPEAREKCVALASRLGFLNAPVSGSGPTSPGILNSPSKLGRGISGGSCGGGGFDTLNEDGSLDMSCPGVQKLSTRNTLGAKMSMVLSHRSSLGVMRVRKSLRDAVGVSSPSMSRPTSPTGRPTSAAAAPDRPTSAVSIISGMEDETADADSLLYGHPVVCFGPGAIFGESGLVNDLPRSASITCYEDTEFLSIPRDEFNKLLKQEIQKEKLEKLTFLMEYIPSMRTLTETAADRVLYQFEQKSVPRNHKFLCQGDLHDGSIYLIEKGSVEVFTKDAEIKHATRRLGMLQRGSVFGTFQPKSPLTFTVVATSSPCEVLILKPENVKLLPEAVLSSLRNSVEQGVKRRKELKTHFTPLVTYAGLLARLPAMSGRPTTGTTNGQLQRPSSGIALKRGASKSSSCTQLPGLPGASSTHPSFEGLFERPAALASYLEFAIEPGESLALEGAKPKKRSSVIKASNSLPSMASVQ